MLKKFVQNTKGRSGHPKVFCKKSFPKNFAKFTGKHLCQSRVFNKVESCNFIKKETLVWVFFCEFEEATSGKRRNIGSPYLVKIYCCGVKCVRKWRVVSHYFKYFKDDIVSKTNICNTENLQQVPCRLSLQQCLL